MREEIMKAFEEIEDYNPYYTGHRVTLKSCFKRARYLSKETSHSGSICNNQDAAKVVFLCKLLSDIKAGTESVQEDKRNIEEQLEYEYKHGLIEGYKEKDVEIQQLKADKHELIEGLEHITEYWNGANESAVDAIEEAIQTSEELITKHKEQGE